MTFGVERDGVIQHSIVAVGVQQHRDILTSHAYLGGGGGIPLQTCVAMQHEDGKRNRETRHCNTSNKMN